MNASNASLQFPQDGRSDIRNADGSPPAFHLHRRIFIGPLPEKVVSQTEAHGHKHHHKGIFLGRASTQENDTDSRTNVSQIIKDHAFHFFMCEGGRQEDWDDEQERSRTEELLERWRETEWGAVWHRRHKRHQRGELRDSAASRWVGGSFEVGHLLGVSVLDEPALAFAPTQEEDPLLDASTLSAGGQNGRGNTSAGVDYTSSVTPTDRQPSLTSPELTGDADASPVTSNTGLLEPTSASMRSTSTLNLGRPHDLEAVSSQASSSSRPNGKVKKQVRYAGEPGESAAPGPVSPTEVLGRTSETVDVTTSAAASARSSPGIPAQDFVWGDVILRGMGGSTSAFSFSV